MTPRVFADAAALGFEAAAEVAATIEASIAASGRADLMLSGGRTPVETYRRLAARIAPSIAARVHVWFCDERAVPPEDEASNARLVRTTFAGPAGIPPDNVHRMAGERNDLDAAAAEYETALPVAMAIVILGLGEDGHIASLFPGSPLIGERMRRVAAVFDSPKPPPCRLTVTPPVLAAARRVIVLATGAAKADAVARALADRGDARLVPGRLVRDREWFVDREASIVG